MLLICCTKQRWVQGEAKIRVYAISTFMGPASFSTASAHVITCSVTYVLFMHVLTRQWTMIPLYVQALLHDLLQYACSHEAELLRMNTSPPCCSWPHTDRNFGQAELQSSSPCFLLHLVIMCTCMHKDRTRAQYAYTSSKYASNLAFGIDISDS